MTCLPGTPADSLELPCAPSQADEFLSRPTDGVRAVLSRTSGRILVLGAGGKMGLHLCAMLQRGLAQLDRNDHVVAVSRFTTLRDREVFQAFGVETIACDLTDAAAVAALPDAVSVFFLAGVKFGTAADPALLRQMNVEVPRIVAARFARSRIVAFSTGCVYPFMRPDSGGATEETPLAPVGDYAKSCAQREEAFAEQSRRTGTAVTLIRLNYSVEFRYGVLTDIAANVWAGVPVDVSTGYVNVIWQRDAIAHAIAALELAVDPPAPINITGAAVLSVRELAVRFGQLLNREVEITGHESETAWLNNAARSHRLFGPPETSLDTMLGWVAAWIARGGETWGKPTGFEKRDGRF
jgi:nucleoside-diphosphate-sugar epimerase